MTHRPTRFDDRSRWHLWVAFLVYLAFVVYGSLVPFEYRVLAWDQAVVQFRNIRFLELDVVSRADWIANIVLYIPLAFLGCSALFGMRRAGWPVPVGVVLVGLLSLATAVAVEFTQQWFSPRTVSLNDLIAESIGTLIGLSLWVFGRAGIARLVDAFVRGGRPSLIAALVSYGLIYLALSLFPYDFVLSAEELRWRLESGNQGWLVASACGALIRCSARLSLDVLASVPLGLIGALLWPRRTLSWFFAVGALVGLVLEPLQLLLASGTSQGASVLLRGVGLVTGALAGAWLRRLGPRPVAQVLALGAPLLAVPYVAGLALVSGWFSVPALSVDSAMARLSEVRWLPLYYHYYTTEPVAMASTLAQLALYAPLGLWAWSSVARRDRARGLGGPWLAAATALALSAVIEGGKLFFPSKHPDPTNWAVAMAGALIAYGLARWLERVLVGGGRTAPVARNGWDATEPDPVHADNVDGRDPGVAPSPPSQVHAAPAAWLRPEHWPAVTATGVGLGALAAIPLLAGTLSFPLAWPVLAVLLALYGALLWARPLAWLLVIPALLPALDLSPITGRLPLDAFDLVVLTTLAVGYSRTWGAPRLPWPNRWFPLALVLLWATWVIAAGRGLWPLLTTQWPPADGSHSPVEAWMVGKGMLWALLLVPLIRRIPVGRLGLAKGLAAQGVLAGLTIVALVVLWERYSFVGLWDFENVFRVTGTFASMNTGGAYIEAFLAFAFPFLAVAVIAARAWWGRGLGVLVAALVSYSMTVTFSRGGWAGLAAGLVVVLLALLRRREGASTWVVAGVLAVAVAGAAVPVLTGGFAQERLARSLGDLKFRVDHWSRAVSLMTPGPVSALVGEGFGQYPLTYLLLADVQRRPGTYAVLRDGTNPYLRLGSGESVFLDQHVAVEPGQTYRLSARVRLPEGQGVLAVPICEKALLYSFHCLWTRLEPGNAGPDWQVLSVEIQSGKLGAGGNWPHPPVKLALHNAGPAPVLEVDDLSLKARDGRDLIANGDFSQGASRWLLVTDQKLAWHIDEQWVELYFAQGLLGVIALTLTLSAAGMALWPAIRSVDPFAVALLGALVGILTVGLLGSILDTPRISMLLYLGALLSVGMFPGRERMRRRRKKHSHDHHKHSDPILSTQEQSRLVVHNARHRIG